MSDQPSRSTKGFDPELDVVVHEFGNVRIEGTKTLIGASVVSYNRNEPKLEIRVGTITKDGTPKIVKGLRISREQAVALLSLLMPDRDVYWDDLTEPPDVD
jgi:hypothetical protein